MIESRSRHAIEDAHVRSAVRSWSCQDNALAVAVPSTHAHASGKAGVVGEETREQAAAVGDDSENGNIRSAAGARTGNDLRLAIAVHVSSGDIDACGEIWIVGKEARQERAIGATEDGDIGAAAGPGATDDVGVAVAVDVAGCHAHAAGE